MVRCGVSSSHQWRWCSGGQQHTSSSSNCSISQLSAVHGQQSSQSKVESRQSKKLAPRRHKCARICVHLSIFWLIDWLIGALELLTRERAHKWVRWAPATQRRSSDIAINTTTTTASVVLIDCYCRWWRWRWFFGASPDRHTESEKKWKMGTTTSWTLIFKASS